MEKITDVMDEHQIEYMEDMNQAFHGREIISNWAIDFEMELTNASQEDKSFLRKKIEFCTGYLDRSKDKDELNCLVLKREIVEAHFRLGNPEEGERLFKQYVEEHPTDGWGWINWSDQYGLFAEEENKNFERAIEILKQGLLVDGVEDRLDVPARLKEIYPRAWHDGRGVRSTTPDERRKTGAEQEPDIQRNLAKTEKNGPFPTEKKRPLPNQKKSEETNRAHAEAGRNIKKAAGNKCLYKIIKSLSRDFSTFCASFI